MCVCGCVCVCEVGRERGREGREEGEVGEREIETEKHAHALYAHTETCLTNSWFSRSSESLKSMETEENYLDFNTVTCLKCV